jgi:hypothetical protein
VAEVFDPVASERWRGVDCGWLGIDLVGHVAMFYTGGEGPIHADADAFDDGAGAALRQMASNSSFELLVAYPRPDDFVEVARRGLYAYDWSDAHRANRDCIEGYELIARPDRPLHWTQLPEPVRHLAAAARVQATFGLPVLSRFAIIDS